MYTVKVSQQFLFTKTVFEKVAIYKYAYFFTLL